MANFERIIAGRAAFEAENNKIKATIPDIPWYPYGIMNNIPALAPLVTPDIDALFAGGKRFADIGAADGDLSFYLESFGNQCDTFDFGPTNYNTLRGIRAMKAARDSAVQINEVDLDEQFKIDGQYDLVFFLGILYHLKNPFYALEKLAKISRYAFLSTRIVRHFTSGGPDVSAYSAAYLVGPAECNNDATNFWMFTEAGLRRILDRCGWNVVNWKTYGADRSNPQDNGRDERAFCALRSRNF